MSPSPLWNKIIGALNKTGIDYVLVGGAALAVHGLSRSTLDLDIFVPANTTTIAKLFATTDTLDLQCDQKALLKICHRPDLLANQWICFSYKGQDILDVFFAAEKDFDRLAKNAQRKGDKDFFVRVAALRDIANMKRVAARPVDIADLHLIQEAQQTQKAKKRQS